jgi:hypothetical protein
MTPRLKVRFAAPFVLGLACAAAPAQQLIGYISTRDAAVTGASDVLDDRAVLSGSVSITAKGHTAPLTLARGGTVSVCQTSILHVTESRAVTLSAPLLFSLDRGALEISMQSTPNDSIMTPDLRFTIRNSGPLDLHMRIARNGDTCVENLGVGAPTLSASDPFGESMYEIAPNQHVLFEHGSLHEVVDHESVPCGCPEPKGMSLADALISPAAAKAASKPGPTPVAKSPEGVEPHPFPAAISEGLAPTPEVQPMPPSGEQLQISGALVYDANKRNGVTKDPDELAPSSSAKPAAPAPSVQPVPPTVQAAAVTPPPPPPPFAAAAPPPPPPHRDFAHAVGHFFRRLFGGH